MKWCSHGYRGTCRDCRCDECPHRLELIPPKMAKPQIFIDMDGVLANFDKTAEKILRTNNIYKYEFIWGPEAFWSEINKHEDFFLSLELMPDAAILWNAVYHLKPRVLTALPKTNGDRVKSQKEAWISMNIGGFSDYDVPVITCKTHEKPSYCNYGDVLIDDRAVNKPAWIAKGGRYIVHTSAADSVKQLQEMGVI